MTSHLPQRFYYLLLLVYLLQFSSQQVLPLSELPNGCTCGAPTPPYDTEGNAVVVDTAFAGVNYADICIRWGLYDSAKKMVLPAMLLTSHSVLMGM